MFCESCGFQLKAGAKFCGKCGAKLGIAEVAQEAFRLQLSPLPLGLKECGIKIIAVSTEGPDSDGDFRSTNIKFEVRNSTDQDWDYLWVRSQIIGSGGQIIDDRQESFEQLISAGENEELETSIYGIKAKLLGEKPEDSHVVVSVYAASLSQQKLGQFDVPEAPMETIPFQPTKVGDSIQLVSGGMWKTEPDDDQDARVEIKLLVQNLTNLHLPEIKLIAAVTDKSGRELFDAGTYDDVRPDSLAFINGSGYTKNKKLKGSKVDLALRVLTPVASGFAQCSGITITPDEATDENESSDDDSESDSSTDDANQDLSDFMINAGWEQRGDKIICRWFVAWKPAGELKVAGAIAGFSGGGTFQVERFYGQLSKDLLTKLWIDNVDKISGDEISFDDLPVDVLTTCESALDCIWEWNDNDIWGDSDEVILDSDKQEQLTEEGDLLLLDKDFAPFVRNVCEEVGLTAAPAAKPTVTNNHNEYRTELEDLVSKYDEELTEMSDKIADNLRLNGDFAEIIGSGIEYDLDMGIRFEMYEEAELFTLYINVDTSGSDSDVMLSDDQGEQIRDFVGDIYSKHFKAFSSRVLSKSDREKWLQAFSMLFDSDIKDGHFYHIEQIGARVRQNGERYVDE